jgi:transcriptional regulator with XRE-family HTH domain
MKMSEKLARLMRHMNLSKVARASGVSRPVIDKYLTGARPRSDLALSLARTLGVDPAWLIDDAQAWPPKRVESAEPSHAA